MRTRLIVILIFVLALFPTSVGAQSALKLESLKVSLWSEYDQPSMLVIYDFRVPPDTQFPATLDIRISLDGNITAVAFIDTAGQMLNTEYAGPRTEGEWQIITVFIKEDAPYRIEYYQPLTRADDNRLFNYEWTGDYAVNNFSVEVKLPADSTTIQTTPNLSFELDSPFLNGNLSAIPLEAKETFQLELGYTRFIEETVFAPSSPQVEASEPITQNTLGRVTLNNLPYILGAIGVVLIVVALYYFRNNNPTPASQPRKRTHKSQDDLAQVYCHECGTRAHTDDRFCRTCGTKLRRG